MAAFIDSDRGPVYTLVCTAVAFGIVMGGIIVPLLMFFWYIAGAIFLLISPFLWIPLAVVLCCIVYYIGVFITAAIGYLVMNPMIGAVDVAAQWMIERTDKARTWFKSLRAIAA